MTKFISDNSLLYYNQKIKQELNKKVDKVEGKGLSTNDLTDELKQKILNAGDSSFSGNYADLKGIPTDLVHDENYVHISNNNQLTNGAGYQTSTDVQGIVNDAISGITGIDFQVVESLPVTGQKGVIYLISNGGSASNIYDEYIWLSSSSNYEKIGTTDVDLSNYWSKTDLTEATNSDIDEIFNPTTTE